MITRSYKNKILLGLWSCLLCSCSSSLNVGRAPSTLIIMVDQLGFHNISCADSSSENAKANPWQGISGFQILCNESVRFTHAYTPSTMSVSAIASIFTGKYPMEHGLRQNGNQFLGSQLKTLAKAAVTKNVRTSFFSGGAPVFRKSGLSQGFEVFDDNIQVSFKRFYRPASENIRMFLNWHDQESVRRPFFSSLYLADLQFEDVPTTNAVGEVRETSFSSQIEYLDESLGSLFQEMKRQKIWESTNVVVVGLNGHGSEEHSELRALNLYGEATHVSLFLKPAGDQKGAKNFDSDISLVDLGATLFDMMGEISPSSKDENLRGTSFKNALRDRSFLEAEKKLIVSESSWSLWRKIGDMRFAVRTNNLLVFNDKTPRYYDTLDDNSELNNLGSTGTHSKALSIARQFFSDHRILDFVSISEEQRKKFAMAKDLWRGVKPSNELLSRLSELSEKHPEDMQLLEWRSNWDLRLDRWKQLRITASQASNPIWQFVADKNLNFKAEIPTDSCLNLIQEYSGGRVLNPRDCHSEEFFDLVTWLDSNQSLSTRQRAMENFLKAHADRFLSDRVAELNYLVGMSWDLSILLPRGPSISDLVLALPENRKYRQVLAKRLSDLGY